MSRADQPSNRQLLLPGFEEVLGQASVQPSNSANSKIAKMPWVTYGSDIDWNLFETLDPTHPPVILSLGMGVDSVAMLLRFLFEPEC